MGKKIISKTMGNQSFFCCFFFSTHNKKKQKNKKQTNKLQTFVTLSNDMEMYHFGNYLEVILDIALITNLSKG